MAEGILNPIEQLDADFDFDVYTKQEVDALLDEKADKSDTYTKTETDALLDGKADADAVYTKTETDNLLDGKADADSVYTKQEIDTKIPSSVGSATKPTYVNGGVITECTHELNKTVPANAVFTDTTYSAGNGLNLSGTSFSAKAGTNVTVDASGINVNGGGTVASADGGLISGGTAYTELRPTLDGTWVKNAQTTATNLQKLEGGIEYLYGLLSHQYDQLKKYINGNYYDYDTDTNSAYTKTVLAGAMPYASLDSIGGKTLVWNQLADFGTITTSATFPFTAGTQIVQNHKYYISAQFNISTSVDCLYIYLRSGGSNRNLVGLGASPSKIFTAGYSGTSNGTTQTSVEGNFWIYTASSIQAGDSIDNIMLIDLTLLYGTGNEPSTVAEFQQQFPAQYYPYNAGTLLSAGVTEVVSRSTNIFDYDNYKAIIQSLVYPVTRGTVAFSGNGFTVTATGNDAYTVYSKNISTAIKPSVKYTLSATVDKGGGSLWLFGYNSVGGGTTNNHINFASAGRHSVTITATSATVLLGYRFGVDTNGVAITFSDIQIEESATATDYKPHILASYPIPAEVQALEGYGWSAGSVYNYVDYERKVFVQNVGSVDLGTLSYTYTADWNGAGVFISNSIRYGDAPIKNPSTDNTVANAIYPNYATKSRNDLYNATANGLAFNTSGTLMIRDSAYTDATAFTNAMSGVYMYYELATPQEIDISAYLTDDNLIEVESGGTLTFPNSNGTDYQIPVPSSETYMVDLQEAI